MINSENNKGKKRLPIAKRLELINKMIKSGKAGHAGYHNPDKLKPEIGSYDPLISLVTDFHHLYHFFLFRMTLLSLHILELRILGVL